MITLPNLPSEGGGESLPAVSRGGGPSAVLVEI
jgi:hypothetical protein